MYSSKVGAAVAHADVKAVDRDGRTPLHDAARTGWGYAVSLLIEAGADVKAVDKDGRTPLHDTTRAGSGDAVDRLIKCWDRETKSHAAKFSADPDHSSYHEEANGPSLPDVIRDRIWPFYSNWLHLPLGPCTRTAEFERNEHGIITSVTIYIICSELPGIPLRKLIERHTRSLLPKAFSRAGQVLIEFGEGTSTPSTSIVKKALME